MAYEFDLRTALGYSRKRTLRFGEFVDEFLKAPREFLHTSSTLVSTAIQHFGFKIVVRAGEPIISYEIFKDTLNKGTNAVFGQEVAIKHVVDSINSAGRETGPNRGLVLVGPPASGKTNIIDILTHALEEYTKEGKVKLYSFFFEFASKTRERNLEIWSSFRHNPVLLFPVVLPGGELPGGELPLRPRQELFEWAAHSQGGQLTVPTYYQTSTLDKCSIDIIEGLLQSPNNRDKSLYDILEEYVRVEEIIFSNGQAKGLANIDDMRHLRVEVRDQDLSPEDRIILDEHLPGYNLRQYTGAMVSANRGILHIHDGFAGLKANAESEYRPLLMLLGCGKASVQATQANVDATVIMTTNLEEMERLEKEQTSSKLLDRIEKVTVNYLLDANSEMDILRRDMSIMKTEYEVDPNLLRITAEYSVLTRFMPPARKKFHENWSERKKQLYRDITPEKKLVIYAYQSEDPIATISKIPHWHRFRSEALRLNLNLDEPESLTPYLERHPDSITLSESGLFTNEELSLIDDEFMRELFREHYPHEGRHGISVRQLQNIMRNTIAHSDGRKVHVGTFLSQLKRMIAEGPDIHHWLAARKRYTHEHRTLPARKIGDFRLGPGEGDYGDYEGLVKVVKYLYYKMIGREITQATVDREPEQIEKDLRRYLQYVLLANAVVNKAFAHIMVPQFSFIHPTTGEKIDKPDTAYMMSLEKVVAPERDPVHYRQEIAKKFLELQGSQEIQLEEGKTVMSSRKDNVLTCFHNMYACLLSHRRSVEGIDAENLANAFFQKKNSPAAYKDGYSAEIKSLVETILNNMVTRFNYPVAIALDTVVFGLRKKIVDFSKMIC